MQLSVLSSHRIRAVLDDPTAQPLLGIGTGIPAQGFSAQRVTALARRSNIIVRDGRTTPWQANRVVDHEGELYLCGPWIDGETIAEYVGEERTQAEIERLAVAFVDSVGHALEQETHQFCNVTTSLVTADGGVLLLDRELALEINRNLPAPRRQTALFPYLPGRLSPHEASVYSCTTVLWRLVTGAAPCSEVGSEPESDQCHERLRRMPEIHRIAPATPPGVARTIAACLAAPEAQTADVLRALAATIRSEGLREEIGPEESQARITAAKTVVEREERFLARRSFLRTRGRTIVIGVVVALLIGIVPFQIVKGRLEAPSTAGLPPRELVERYYEAWSLLDHIAMDDALARGVGTDVVREVTNVYVVDRVQLAHTMNHRMIPADEWLRSGRPAEYLPYGPANVELTVIRRNESEVIIRAEYEMWRPGAETEDQSATEEEAMRASLTREVRRDNLTLHPSKWGWEITAIKTTQLSYEVIER